MKILNNGSFSVNIDSSKLVKGLRTHSNQPRNSEQLSVLAGVQGKDGTLQRVTAAEFERFSGTPIESYNFPWPQIFTLDKHYIICNEDNILEYDGTNWEIKIDRLLPSAFPWYVASSYDWIYFSNGVTAVIRNPETHTYSLDSSAPIGVGICNYNGQILVGDQQLI